LREICFFFWGLRLLCSYSDGDWTANGILSRLLLTLRYIIGNIIYIFYSRKKY